MMAARRRKEAGSVEVGGEGAGGLTGEGAE